MTTYLHLTPLPEQHVFARITPSAASVLELREERGRLHPVTRKDRVRAFLWSLEDSGLRIEAADDNSIALLFNRPVYDRLDDANTTQITTQDLLPHELDDRHQMLVLAGWQLTDEQHKHALARAACALASTRSGRLDDHDVASATVWLALAEAGELEGIEPNQLIGYTDTIQDTIDRLASGPDSLSRELRIASSPLALRLEIARIETAIRGAEAKRDGAQRLRLRREARSVLQLGRAVDAVREEGLT